MHCILFYKYHPLTDDKTLLETYRSATEKLCIALNLNGRILIGLSNNGEGINGTLAGAKDDLDAYVDCMIGKDCCTDDDDRRKSQRRDAIKTFRHESKLFFSGLNLPELLLDSPSDFKWSSHSHDAATKDDDDKHDDDWFPDLNIKIVGEIVSSGGVLSNISTAQTSVGYLTPREWHEEIKALVEKKKKHQATSNGKEADHPAANSAHDDADVVDTVLIDVRNHKECQIGSFAPGISIDPNTKTFAQFPKWVKDNAGTTGEVGAAATTASSLLNNKRILLYCTGGIRCEKASAYVRQIVPQNKGVFHLKGGIHKYLEEFGGSEEESQFVGKNFVFDRRGALSADDCGKKDSIAIINNGDNNSSTIVGKCLYCTSPYDTFRAENVCTVCREPVLVCSKCKIDLGEKQQCSGTEFHCEDHFHLASCYFTNLSGFSIEELREQLDELNSHLEPLLALKKKGKQRRKSLRKQINKVETFMKGLLDNGSTSFSNLAPKLCRHCGLSSCDNKCWGFHGGNRRVLSRMVTGSDANAISADPPKSNKKSRTPSNQRPSKKLKREKVLSEIDALQIYQPPSQHRNNETGLRCPPPVIRILSTKVKGRWCGQTLQHVITSEFGMKHDWLDQLFAEGLVRINDTKQSLNTILLNGDTISRIVHWHEPPISVPAKVLVTKHPVPHLFGETPSVDSFIYCIDKPSTIPVYPSGPFYANSLLGMVEAQEGLPPNSLRPCHRLDRCTSGVLLCTNTSSAASIVQRLFQCKEVKKLYVARVKGKFPTSQTEMLNTTCPDCASLEWCDGTIEVSAPISVQLDSNGSDEMLKRFVCRDGKPSTSRFRFISYDPHDDLSIVSCCPISGRGHQLRVHLKLLGFPIHNDSEYGGYLDDERKKEQLALSIDAILEASAKSRQCLREESLSLEEVESAIKLCNCCSDVKSSFKDCQLLGSLQSIDLHAFKYCIDPGSANEATFVTELPSWVTTKSGEGLKFI